MQLTENSTVYDVLAILCSYLSVGDERECAVYWKSASEINIREYLLEYSTFLNIIQRASVCNLGFKESDREYINNVLEGLYEDKINKKSHIYLLAKEVENRLERYSGWQQEDVVYQLKPLNSNYCETGIQIFPHTKPAWDTEKSERNRRRHWNAVFCNHIMIREDDIKPFDLVMYYWNDEGVLKTEENGWRLEVALSPVTDAAKLDFHESNTEQGKTMQVDGLINEDELSNRLLTIFDAVFKENYSIIVFPEMLGTDYVVREVKKRMRKHPDCMTIVLMPTICKDGRNTLTVLGPGGVEFLRQNKVAPFFLVDEERNEKREALKYENRICLLHTKELGIVAFPICADLLDPDYYRVVTDAAMVDTIICPSSSPGINGFIETMKKGIPLKVLELYVNNCSAKDISRNGKVSDIIGLIGLPSNSPENQITEMRRECGGTCSEGYCYLDINICYQGRTFSIEKVHKYGRCA